LNSLAGLVTRMDFESWCFRTGILTHFWGSNWSEMDSVRNWVSIP